MKFKYKISKWENTEDLLNFDSVPKQKKYNFIRIFSMVDRQQIPYENLYRKKALSS